MRAMLVLLTACSADTVDLAPGLELVDRTFALDSMVIVRPRAAAELNDSLRQAILSGENLHGIELDAESLRLFPLSDADDPVFPADNFEPVGSEDCCEFVVDPKSAALFGQWPFSFETDRFSSTERDYTGSSILSIPLVPPDVLWLGPIEGTSIQGRLIEGRIVDGLLSGFIQADALAQIPLEIPLDADTDGDGVEDAVAIELELTAVRAHLMPR